MGEDVLRELVQLLQRIIWALPEHGSYVVQQSLNSFEYKALIANKGVNHE